MDAGLKPMEKKLFEFKATMSDSGQIEGYGAIFGNVDRGGDRLFVGCVANISDLVKSGITGQIVPAGDPETMAQQIVRFANAPEHARRMGQLGRERVEERFSMNAMVAAYLGAYDQLLGRCGVTA